MITEKQYRILVLITKFLIYFFLLLNQSLFTTKQKKTEKPMNNCKRIHLFMYLP